MINLSAHAKSIVAPMASTPIFQDWSGTQSLYTVNLNTGTITPQLFNFKIKDVIGNPAFSAYSSFRLVAYQKYDANNPIPFITPYSVSSGGYPTNVNAPLAITANGLNFNFTPVFQNISLLSQGVYNFHHYFKIEGLNSNGLWIEVANYHHVLKLLASSSGVIFDPTVLYFNHYIGNATPTQNLIVSGLNWQVITPSGIEITTVDLGVTIVPFAQGSKATANGTKTLKIGLKQVHFDAVTAIDVPVNYDIVVIQNNGISLVDCVVVVHGEIAMTASPSEFQFAAVKYLSEPEVQFGVLSPIPGVNYTLNIPPWLQFSEGNFPNLKNFSIVPIPTANMEAGTYNGNVTIDYEISGVSQQLLIPVEYILDGILSNPYQNETAFTLDNLSYTFNTEAIDTYFEILAEIKIYDRYLNSFNTILSLDKLPLRNGSGKINFGKRIHELMKKSLEVNENQLQYLRAELIMNINEISFTNELVNSFATLPQKFVAGNSNGVNLSGSFLKLQALPSRVSKNGYAILNLLLPIGSFTIQTFKNGILQIQTEEVEDTFSTVVGGVFSRKVYFSNYTQGDRITYKLYNLQEEIDSQEFIIFPEGRFNNMLVFENNFLVNSCFEFHGGFNVKSDFENLTQTNYIDLVEALEIIESKSVQKFTINTGWILKNDIDTIDALLRSKRIWLITPDENVALRPISKSITGTDSERELYSYDLEFQINKKYNEKNYSF